jgi:hypothetical protein
VNYPLTLALSLWGREDYSCHYDFKFPYCLEFNASCFGFV